METVLVSGKPLLKILEKQTAMILVGNFDWTTVSKGTHQIGGGSAVPITEDGYFLTASHVVSRGSSLMLARNIEMGNGQLDIQGVPARIVWKSDRPWVGLDLALIHARTEPIAPFAIANEPPDIDEPIVTAGWPIGFFDSFPQGARLAAGQVVSVSRKAARGSSPPFVTVRHDAPQVSGDSGGPVLDLQGNLVGVHRSSNYSFWQLFAIALGRAPSQPDTLDYFASAIMPDPDWLREVIQRDRERTPDSPVKPAR